MSQTPDTRTEGSGRTLGKKLLARLVGLLVFGYLVDSYDCLVNIPVNSTGLFLTGWSRA